MSPPAPAPSRLARKLGPGDAVVVGLGSMIGAGVFSAVGPAVRAAGNAAIVALAIAAGLATCNATSSAARAARLWPLAPAGARAILQAAGLLFFAFAGYARIATLGEEVIEPARTIPRAIPIALGLTFAVYAAVLGSALAAADTAVLAAAP